MLPPSPREIRMSSSRKVVNNQDCARSVWIGNFKGGWPERVLATLVAMSWRGCNNPRAGVKSIVCPNTSTLEGTSTESGSFGAPMIPSSNFTWSHPNHTNKLPNNTIPRPGIRVARRSSSYLGLAPYASHLRQIKH